MRRSLLVSALMAVVCAVSPAQASIVYQYVLGDKAGNSGLVFGADGRSATLALGVGQSYTANVFLQETIDGVANSSSFIQSQNGLILAGFRVSRTAGDGKVVLAGNTQSLPDGFNPNGTVGGTLTGSPDANLTEGFLVVPAQGVQGVKDGNVLRVLLGSVTFTNNGADSWYTLTARTGLNNSTRTYSQNIGLDTTTSASGNIPAFSGARDLPFSIVVSQVPEPATGVALLGLVLAAVRRPLKR